jgi:hypothetical protein
MRHQMGSAPRRLPYIQHLSAPEVNGRPKADQINCVKFVHLWLMYILVGAVYYFSLFFVFYRKGGQFDL